MTEAEITATARGVARVLLSKLEGEATDIDAWLALGRSLGLKLFGFYGKPSDPPGYYDGKEGLVFYNLKAPRHLRLRYIIHELAHHVLATWPGSKFPREALERYDDCRQSVQHRVARRVETMVAECWQGASGVGLFELEETGDWTVRGEVRGLVEDKKDSTGRKHD